jgi:hypothetical protein
LQLILALGELAAGKLGAGQLAADNWQRGQLAAGSNSSGCKMAAVISQQSFHSIATS